MITREQLQQIRDAVCNHGFANGWSSDLEQASAILDAALAAPEQEPVAWQERQAIGERDGVYRWSDWYSCKYNTEQVVKARLTSTHYEWRPLYTAPVAAPQPVSMETVYDTIIEWSTAGKGSRRELARRMIALFAAPQREWVSLDSDDLLKLPSFDYDAPQFIAEKQFVQAVDAALKEKNHE